MPRCVVRPNTRAPSGASPSPSGRTRRRRNGSKLEGCRSPLVVVNRVMRDADVLSGRYLLFLCRFSFPAESLCLLTKSRRLSLVRVRFGLLAGLVGGWRGWRVRARVVKRRGEGTKGFSLFACHYVRQQKYHTPAPARFNDSSNLPVVCPTRLLIFVLDPNTRRRLRRPDFLLRSLAFYDTSSQQTDWPSSVDTCAPAVTSTSSCFANSGSGAGVARIQPPFHPLFDRKATTALLYVGKLVQRPHTYKGSALLWRSKGARGAEC